jgi:hypothetical protein
MKSYLIFLVLLIILILVLIFAIIYHNFLNTTTIEKFGTPIVRNEFIYPQSENIDGTSISVNDFPSPINYIIMFTSRVEQVEIPLTDYLLTVHTSFKTTGNIINTLKSNASSVTLLPNNFPQNYICFDFPEDSVQYTFSKMVITLNQNYNTNLFVLLSINVNAAQPSITEIKLKKQTVTSAQTITYEAVDKNIRYCNILLGMWNTQTAITINSIRFYFTDPVSDREAAEAAAAAEAAMESENPGSMLGDNPNEELLFPTTTIVVDDSDTSNYLDPTSNPSCKPLKYKFKNLLKLKTPWAVYDTSSCSMSDKKITELLGRQCRNASIEGSGSSIVKNENDYFKYLKGSINTYITFPEGSMPNEYTICAITKYYNSYGGNILKSASSPQLLIGHADSREGMVKFNGTSYGDNTAVSSSTSGKWIVTCIKSAGNNVSKQIIINDKFVGTANLGNYGTNNGKLMINNSSDNKINCSEFGLAYLIIWDTALLDNELVIVSKILNEYVNKSVAISIPSSLNININDGSTPEKAGVSAIAIRNITCTNKNGIYWIKPTEKSIARPIFCIMDKNCHGGGWMLAMKGKQNSQTFLYESDYWTKELTLVPEYDNHIEGNGLYLDTSIDAKYDIYNTFPVTQCLAMFDPREFPGKSITKRINNRYVTIKSTSDDNSIYTDPSNKMYGWRWHKDNFNNGNPITLLEFFKSDKRDYNYTCVDPNDGASLTSFLNSQTLDNKNINPSGYMKYDDFTRDILGRGIAGSKAPYNELVWSTQRAYLSYGFNCYLTRYAPHWYNRVRWGGTFNENNDHPPLPNSNDTSGGIGMDKNKFSAGDSAGCCADWPTGANRSLSFKWFIK